MSEKVKEKEVKREGKGSEKKAPQSKEEPQTLVQYARGISRKRGERK